MQTYPYEIPKPTADATFEDMCARVYGEVFDDPLPTMNGRRGQAQGGVDVFVRSKQGRVGIQCKRYQDGTLKLTDIQTEVGRADKAGTPIVRLLVATTAASDAKLHRDVQELSDQREAAGLFPVDVQFWHDICNHINARSSLQNDYAPLSPGGAFYRQDQANVGIQTSLGRIEAKLAVTVSAPSGLANSVDSYITGQLNGINDLLTACRFRDALEALERIGSDQSLFDEHQKARWLIQRGICKWHRESATAAAPDFLRAAELYPDDEKVAAAGIRGLFLGGQLEKAVEAGKQALDRFPSSVHVWIAAANARTLSGQAVHLRDAPASMRDHVDVLTLVASSRHQAGELAEAVTLSNRAMRGESAGFFTRSAALTHALEAAAKDPVKAAFNQVEERFRVALEEAVATFDPRSSKLWSVQDIGTLGDTLAHLGYAYLVLGRPEETLALVDEARVQQQLSPRLVRVTIEAHRRLEQTKELVSLGRSWFDSLEEEALVTLAESASIVADVDLVEAILAKLPELPEFTVHAQSLVRSMRWIAMWRNNSTQKLALQEVTEADLTSASDIPLICAGARILYAAGKLDQATAATERAAQILPAKADSSTRLMVADLLFATDKLGAAATHYANGLAIGGFHSELHNKLLLCYVRSGEYRNARKLIESFPDEWTNDDRAVSLAIELGQETSDFEFLEPLAKARCERYPGEAGGWCLKLSLEQRARRMQAFHATLLEVPQLLEGSPRQVAQIAAMEIRFGSAEQGMRRLYRLYRQNMGDAEVASLIVTLIVGARKELPFMHDVEDSVSAGSWVRLSSEDGNELELAIDPVGLEGLPQRDGFYGAASAEVAPLLGAVSAGKVMLKGALNMSVEYKVEHIGSAFHYLLRQAQEVAQSPLAAKSSIISIAVPKTDDGADFSQMHAMLKRQKEHSQNALNVYESGPMTLGILCRILSHNIADVVAGWDLNGPALYVGSGLVQERERCAELLQREDATYVIDAATITELVDLDCEHALKAFHKVYVSNHSVDLLQFKLAESKMPYEASGQLFDDNGVMRFVEYTEKHLQEHQAYCQRLVDTALTYCETSPAYGPEVIPPDLVSAKKVLAEEEYATLLLASEKKATLITIDGRLAELARVLVQLDRVWPQEVIRYGCLREQLKSERYVEATVRMFLRNRSFVSVGPLDLLFMSHQGAFTLRAGLQRFKDYVSSERAELVSAITVVFEFLASLAVYPIKFKAYVEVFSHLIEALNRHPKCNQEVLRLHSIDFIENIAQSANDHVLPYRSAEMPRERRVQVQQDALYTSLLEAIEFANKPDQRRPIRLSVLKCTRSPMIVYDGDEDS